MPFDIVFGPIRAHLAASLRTISPYHPASWEFSCYSNSGEDGILDYLLSRAKKIDRSFVEIGSANGISNNTSFLAIIKLFSGLMIEGDGYNSYLSSLVYRKLNRYDIRSINQFVTVNNIGHLIKSFPSLTPDVFSIDIDGMDYYILKGILEAGVAPKIIVVEYNANFGPELAVTIPHQENFDYSKAHESRLYFGVSLKGWIKLLSAYGYVFIDTDCSGVNAFFVNADNFDSEFLDSIQSVGFRDNVYEASNFGINYSERYKLISNMPIVNI